ncbi:MAG TPA: hypothetical protein DEA57_06090 [Sulfurihydrogenibium sp.]|uniref:hypothetical protein n=1 Tax=Sulfurihydrogenibium sp. (strain YO3AOP1) TaxID=436114 RepID=UPI000314059D|nr:hypothetical protein [Sulfurihydrogenibium sp. YO3AOP1]HBT99024.1 hypothetical protein [Sulfurihydrogenibium sp.]
MEVIEKARWSGRHSLYQAILKAVKNLPFAFKKIKERISLDLRPQGNKESGIVIALLTLSVVEISRYVEFLKDGALKFL